MTPPARAPRVCPRCESSGNFSGGYRAQKVCDSCRADPGSLARARTPRRIATWRTRNAAVARLIEAHRDEYDAYLSEERSRYVDWRQSATLREIDDYERRVEEAAASRGDGT